MKQLVLDNSAIGTYARCNRLYNINYLMRRTSASPRIATYRGTIVHQCFNRHLNNEPFSDIIQSALTELTYSIEDQKQRLTEHTKLLSAINVLCANYKTSRTDNGLLRIHYNDSGNPRFIVRHTEVAFQYPLGTIIDSSGEEIECIYTGAVDAIVEDGNGQWFLLELKTSGSATSSLWRSKWQVASQPKGYTFIANHTTAKPVAGIIIIPVMTGNKLACTLADEIMLRYSPHELSAWQTETLHAYEEIANSRFLPTGQYSGTCASTDFGKCDMFDYCRSDCNPGILQQLTVPNTWSPLGNLTFCHVCEVVYDKETNHTCSARKETALVCR